MYPAGFEEELKSRAGYVFDWSREKDPVVKERKIHKCVSNLKQLLSARRLVSTTWWNGRAALLVIV